MPSMIATADTLRFANFQQGPDASVVPVTPELASQWIARNNRNRNIRGRHVSALARDMAAGNWQLTGEAIKFDTNGDLLDGQHRLMAVIKSGATVSMFVIRGLSPDSQSVMDSGAKRQASDALHLGRGHRNASLLAATARLALLLEESGGKTIRGGGGSYTHSEIAAWVDANPDSDDATQVAGQVRKLVDLSPSVIALGWLIQARIDRDAANEFWQSVANNSTNGPGDPRNTLIRRVSSARRSGERLPNAVQLGFVLRAWNAWRKGDELHILRDRASNGKGGTTAVTIPRAV